MSLSPQFLGCWCSLLSGSFTPVLDSLVHVLWPGVCSGRKGLLFAVPPAQGWLTSCLHNFETFLFSLTSGCRASSEAIYEACHRNCTVLPDTTLHHFFSLKLADRAAVDFSFPQWNAAFILVRAVCHNRRVHASPGLIANRSRHRGAAGQGWGAAMDLWVRCSSCGVWLRCAGYHSVTFTGVKASHSKIIKQVIKLSRITPAGLKTLGQIIWLSWGALSKAAGVAGCSGSIQALCAAMEQILPLG